MFNGRTTEATQKCHWIHKQEMEINGAFSKRRVMGTGAGHLTEACVKWKAPPAAWVTINVDGSCYRTIGKAACGGLLRDQTGSWLGGYTFNIGCCTVEEAEAWGVLQGFQAAARIGLQNIIIESDSRRTILSLKGASRCHGHCKKIIARCLGMANSFANDQYCHVLREQNRIADSLAKQALTHPFGRPQYCGRSTKLVARLGSGGSVGSDLLPTMILRSR